MTEPMKQKRDEGAELIEALKKLDTENRLAIKAFVSGVKFALEATGVEKKSA